MIGNVTRKKLGSELLCLVGMVRNLKVFLREIESHWKM